MAAISITPRANLAVLRDVSQSLVLETLAELHLQPRQARSGQVVWDRVADTYYRTADDEGPDVYHVPVGLVPLAVARLRACGIRVRVIMEGEMPPPGSTKLDSVIQQHHVGHLRCNNLADAASIIAMAVDMYPESRPVIIAANSQEASRIAKRLMDVLPIDWDVQARNYSGSKPQTVAVVTMQRLGGVGLRRHDLVFLCGWPAVRGWRSQETMIRTGHAFRYALTWEPVPRMSARQWMHCLATTGDVIYDATGDACGEDHMQPSAITRSLCLEKHPTWRNRITTQRR